MVSQASFAGCDENGLPIQTSTVPVSSGTILFEATDTLLNPPSQQLFLFNAATHVQTDFTATWRLATPSNPHVSPDGKYVVFFAVLHNRTDIFMWKVGSASYVNLTGHMTNLRYEDPSFTFDGQALMAKQLSNIVEYSLDFKNPNVPKISGTTVFTTDGVRNTPTEASGPWMSPDGRYVFFWRGTSAYPPVSVRSIYVPSGVESAFAPNVSNFTDFPVVRDYSVVFYVGHTTESGDADQIFLQAPNVTGTTPLQLPSNACHADNSDPAPLNDDDILFSNDFGGNGYVGYIGAISQASVWALSQIGLGISTSNIRGMTYTPYSLAPP
jgi:Tol biopolymer transport system component